MKFVFFFQNKNHNFFLGVSMATATVFRPTVVKHKTADYQTNQPAMAKRLKSEKKEEEDAELDFTCQESLSLSFKENEAPVMSPNTCQHCDLVYCMIAGVCRSYNSNPNQPFPLLGCLEMQQLLGLYPMSDYRVLATALPDGLVECNHQIVIPVHDTKQWLKSLGFAG